MFEKKCNAWNSVCLGFLFLSSNHTRKYVSTRNCFKLHFFVWNYLVNTTVFLRTFSWGNHTNKKNTAKTKLKLQTKTVILLIWLILIKLFQFCVVLQKNVGHGCSSEIRSLLLHSVTPVLSLLPLFSKPNSRSELSFLWK